MGFRYLGNKKAVLPQILDLVGNLTSDLTHKVVASDLFCGTASVARAFRENGYSVLANDHLLSCEINARVALLSDGRPEFEGIALGTAKGAGAGGRYEQVLRLLESLPAKEGFVFREYSSSGCPANGSQPRKYFVPSNAGRIDAIRQQIADWIDQGQLTQVEEAVLLQDLIFGVNRVANTAGTYGHFLSKQSTASTRPLALRPNTFLQGLGGHKVFCDDVFNIARQVSSDIAYLDPPYTKRQYAAYYHLLETIVANDSPEVIGKSGLRPWRTKDSPFCHKRRVSGALAELLDCIDAQTILLSYTEDGHLSHEEILSSFASNGRNSGFLGQDHSRYVSNTKACTAPLRERVYWLQRSKSPSTFLMAT